MAATRGRDAKEKERTFGSWCGRIYIGPSLQFRRHQQKQPPTTFSAIGDFAPFALFFRYFTGIWGILVRMGIPGLINALGPGERISLSKLAITHLERTSRPIRVAVDISIWLFQVQAGRGGKNPELRTLFYRLIKILALPIHPLFVYDGKDKPPFKRGKAVSGRSYGNAPIIRLSKILIDLFKFPRHDAPGEAEAECARLQMAGVVDAVMSNDVDALMFGSTLTVMNFSKESGSGSGAATHVTCYDMGGDTAKVKLDRSGMILFAMLSGGDYLPSGVPKCGSKLAAEIAKAGFGADLLEALNADGDEAELTLRLNDWRDRLQYELEENESGYFQTKHKVVRIPETFPDRTILSFYSKPVVSTDDSIESLRNRLRGAWDQDIDVAQIRQFVADAFEWNYRSGARKVIRLLAEPLVSYNLRLGNPPLGLPRLSNIDTPMLQKAYKSRTSFSTDGLTELQVEIVPVDIVGLDLLAEEPNPPLPTQESTISGDEEAEAEMEPNSEAAPPTPSKKRVTKRYDPYSTEKVWIFETVLSIGIPEVVENWKKEEAAKLSAPKKTANRRTGPKKRKELDPSMKHGSILKYGTLTKGRTEMSEFKQAQVFEAAITSVSPTKSPQYPGNGRYGLQTMSTTPEPDDKRPDGFDYLVNRFSSCSLSPSPSGKRHPMATRSRVAGRCTVHSGEAEVEVVEVLSDEELSPPTPSGRLRMSYSNASYKDIKCSTDASKVVDTVKPRAKSKPSRQSVEQEESPEILELENSLSSIQLDDDVAEQRTRKNQFRSRKVPQLKKTEDPKPSTKYPPEPHIQEISADDTHPAPRRKGKPKKKAQEQATVENHDKSLSTTSKNPAIENLHSGPTDSTLPTHMESITVCGGYWTVDPESTATENSNTTNDNDKDKRSKKKRIPRVSILDLS